MKDSQKTFKFIISLILQFILIVIGSYFVTVTLPKEHNFYVGVASIGSFVIAAMLVIYNIGILVYSKDENEIQKSNVKKDDIHSEDNKGTFN